MAAAGSSPFVNLAVEAFDREVLIRAAADPAVFSGWTNSGECGRAEDLPMPSAEAQTRSAIVRLRSFR